MARIQVAVSEIPYTLSQIPELQGDYNRLIDRIEGIEVLYLPPARAGRMFDKSQVDCLFPGSTATMNVPFEVLQSDSVLEVTAYVFTQEPYTDIKQFSGKNIALRRGFSFGNIRNRLNANFIELESESRAIKFLKRNRVDAVIGYRSDMESAAKSLTVEPLYFNESRPLYVAEEAFVCHDTEANRRFFLKLNPIIQTFRKEGEE